MSTYNITTYIIADKIICIVSKIIFNYYIQLQNHSDKLENVIGFFF